ncbi:16971_t:CDS:2 [Gigaspora margarita]|uniref:16971_t:CDS:1 n=1 Tax=Gigaspora margarita TaxID=4874 RepID=A0ABN7U2E6_GIGMA|nr:16971_t:CDS:2 [Gigaspora margarita]
MTEEQKIELTETSNAEEIEATSLKYEEKLKKEREEKKVNLNAYLKEKQKRIDVEEENNRLKEKLEKKTLEGLREKELERKTQKEQDNLLKTMTIEKNAYLKTLENKVVYDRTFRTLELNEDREDFKREVNVIPFRLGRLMDTVEYEITNEERFEEALESEIACKEFTKTLIEQTAENIDLRLEEKIPQLICYPQDPDDKSSDYTPMETKIRSYKRMICLIDSKAKNTIDIGGYKDNVNFPALDLEKRFGPENVLEDNLPNNYGMMVFDERCLQLYKRGKQKGFRHKEEAENAQQQGTILTKPVIRKNLEKQVKELEQLLNEEGQKEQEWEQEINQATQHIQRLEKQIQALTILADKRKEDLEREKQALIELAKQKIANKKEASELLKQKQLTEQGEQEKKDWEKERKKYEEKDQEIQQLKTTSDNLQQGLNDLQEQNKELIKEKEQLTQELALKNN